jgi:hypothetical protein
MIDVRARDRSGAWNGLRFIPRGLGVLLTLLFVTSCGNGIFIVGTPVLTMTSQRGHFTSYVVNIDAIEMTRKDGTIVEFPTVNLRVDLAQISSVVNLLETPALGEGTYVSATLVLDYTQAPYITVDYQGTLGGATTLIDAQTGTTPTTQTFTITLDPNNPMVIGNQTAALVNFDIDLEASNTIDYSKGLPATVTIHPIVSVTSTPVYTKPTFTRGIFVFVDTKNNNFVMNTRPLHDVISNQTYGALTVIPNDQTYWNIDGVTYVGAAGLAKLNTMQSQTAELQIGAVGVNNPVGNLNADTPTFTATEVYVGESLESTIEDHILGVVSAINGNTITVAGGWLVDRLGDPGFGASIPVTVGSSTIVSADGNANVTPALSSVSVGQFIDVAGAVTYLTDGSTNPASLDATLGQIRIQPTTLWGTLNSTATGTADVDLLWLGHYEPNNFTFTGTGSSGGGDATAANYAINTGSLAVPTSPAGALFPGLLQIVGTANTFGQGPPYFNATAITDASQLPQQIILEWSGTGSSTPYTAAATASGLSVNLNDANLAPGVAGALHVLRSGPQNIDVNTLTNPNPGVLTIIPSTAAGSQFTIGDITNGLFVFNTPSDFAAKVVAVTSSTYPTYKLVATGQYDPTTGSFTATNIEISVK